jgi:hypothetical protein
MNPSEMSPVPAEDHGREIKFLNIIAGVAVLDVLLLIPLVWASRWLADKENVVHVLGPIHGFFFVVLVFLCIYGCVQRWWGWWFPIVVVITGGAIGSLIGDWVIRKQLKEKSA